MPVGPLEGASVLRSIASGGWPAAVLDELVAVALVVEPGELAAAVRDMGIVLQIAEVTGLTEPVAATEDESRRVVKLQAIDHGRQGDRLPGPARTDDADAAFNRFPPSRTHVASRERSTAILPFAPFGW